MDPRTKTLLKTYFCIWFLIGAVPACLLIPFFIPAICFAIRSCDIRSLLEIPVVLSYCLGPWFGLITTLPGFDVDLLVFPVGYTAVLLMLMVLPFYADKDWLKIICMTLYVALVIGWYCIGFGQMVSSVPWD